MVFITYQKVAVENCKAMFDVPFERTIDPSIYRYKINILEQILPVINIPISTVHGQLKITGKFYFRKTFYHQIDYVKYFFYFNVKYYRGFEWSA